MTIRAYINQRLQHGDVKNIAERLGIPYHVVSRQIKGSVNVSDKVADTAIAIFRERKVKELERIKEIKAIDMIS